MICFLNSINVKQGQLSFFPPKVQSINGLNIIFPGTEFCFDFMQNPTLLKVNILIHSVICKAEYQTD